ncbi:MAG: hypothetical protein NC122_00145 [Faecalibacterium sp.]|nr:hypothetical protein [Ruminococcus sp.]MCM1391390.1 hypothetical protein [Ruminococcus sp.]MCM1484600.1 hypothetical protein [Faecalibacterium sp.]
MEEYSYNDFAAMQQQAITRVREMQKKAVPNERQKSEPKVKPQNEPQPKPIAELPKIQPPPKSEPTRKSQSQSAVQKNPLAFLSGLDSDMSLILPLMLLLGKEGADSILLLALLYIVS